MTYISSSILSLSLLTLWALLPACNPNQQRYTDPVSINIDQLHDLIRQSGRDYVVVNIFATWSKPSRLEIPELLYVQNKPESLTEVLFVSIDDSSDLGKNKLADFLKENNGPFRSFHLNPADAVRFISDYYSGWNEQLPLNLVFSREGRLIYVTGMTDRHEIEMIVHKDQYLP